MRGAAVSLIAVLLLASPVAGCGGGDDPPDDLGPADVRANLDAGGYEVGEDITDGANLSLPPSGKIDADVYFGVEAGPEQEPGLTAGVYFFSDPADAQTVAAAFSDTLHEVRDTRLYNVADDDEDVLNALVETGEGD
jgi:predicted small lipoprotein YifL